MHARHPALDGFAFALGIAALGAVTLWFAYGRNGAAVVMCALCLAGILGGRLAGISGGALFVVGVGLTVILLVAWVDPPGGPLRTSFMAHAGGGALVGWALALALHSRIEWPWWGLATLFAVGALTIAWELGEYAGDRLLDTALVPSKRDSAFDIVFGCLAGAAAVVGVHAASRGTRR
jgi:hypothetical protein